MGLKYISSVRRQKGLTGYCFTYIDRPFCLRTDDFCAVVFHVFENFILKQLPISGFLGFISLYVGLLSKFGLWPSSVRIM